MINNILGLFSFLLSAIALYLQSIPDKSCYILFLISFALQALIFYRTKQWFLIVQMVMLSAFTYYVYISWITKGIG